MIKKLQTATMMIFFLGAITTSAYAEDAPASGTDNFYEWFLGNWVFSLGERTGTRAYSLSEKGSVLEWTEEFDESDIVGEGYFAIDLSTNKVVSMSVYNREGAISNSKGTINSALDQIEYDPKVGPDQQGTQIHWRRVNGNEFAFDAYQLNEAGKELRWTAKFKRATID